MLSFSEFKRLLLNYIISFGTVSTIQMYILLLGDTLIISDLK